MNNFNLKINKLAHIGKAEVFLTFSIEKCWINHSNDWWIQQTFCENPKNKIVIIWELGWKTF